MSWLHIIHQTTYRYNKAVRLGPHRLVLRPREGHDVHIEEMHVKIEPEFELEWSRDLFGNCVATAHNETGGPFAHSQRSASSTDDAFPAAPGWAGYLSRISPTIFGNGIGGC